MLVEPHQDATVVAGGGGQAQLHQPVGVAQVGGEVLGETVIGDAVFAAAVPVDHVASGGGAFGDRRREGILLALADQFGPVVFRSAVVDHAGRDEGVGSAAARTDQRQAQQDLDQKT